MVSPTRRGWERHLDGYRAVTGPESNSEARLVVVDGAVYRAQWGDRTRADIAPPVVIFLIKDADTPGSELLVSWTSTSGPQPKHLEDAVVAVSVRIAY